ncbi:MAG: M55 family metallopeptidase [Gammaproteobacteria bacterium]|nr:M55 family metallopeptidase [Gammaproteobacteria bacterium]
MSDTKGYIIFEESITMLRLFKRIKDTKIDRPSILIYVDMEGVCGVTKWSEVTPGTREYFAFQGQMTDEVNAAIEGAFAGGAGRVLINDLHWYYNNLLWHCLDQRAEIRRGANLVLDVLEQDKQEKIDALFLIGFHAMARTENAILPHTWALPDHLDALSVNHQKIGEIGMIAYAGAARHAPMILVTGDEACFEEVDPVAPDSEKVCVKKLKGGKAVCFNANKKIKEIKKAAKYAVKNLIKRKQAITAPKISAPFEFMLEFPSREMATQAQHISYPVVQKGNQIIFLTDSYRKGLDLFFDSVALTF